jgi:hypothetical protein
MIDEYMIYQFEWGGWLFIELNGLLNWAIEQPYMMQLWVGFDNQFKEKTDVNYIKGHLDGIGDMQRLYWIS